MNCVSYARNVSKPKVVHTGVRQGHRARIFRLLSEHGALSRAELAALAGLSRVSLADLSTELIDSGALVILPPEEGSSYGRGRPVARLALNPRSGTLLGVEFGNRRIHVAVVNAAHEIVVDGAVRHEDTLSWDDRIEKALELIESLSVEAQINLGQLTGVGVGVIGPVVREGSDFSPHTGDRFALSHTTIDTVRSTFAERFGTSVLVDNNARLAALAEAGWGAGASATNLLYVRVSEGVGGGLVVDGRLLSGSFGLAGHIGHVTVKPDGIMCRCGKRGCLETIVAVPSLIRACKAVIPEIDSMADIAAAAQAGNEEVRARLTEAGEALGGVLAAMAVGLNPAEIVFAGDLIVHDDIAFDAAREAFNAQVPRTDGYVPTIRAGRLGDGDGAIGAILAAFRRSPLISAYEEASSIQ